MAVARERMYTERDRHLADVRRVCLALPETSEAEVWGRPAFWVGRRMFAVFTGSGDEVTSVIFKPEADERPALVADPRFFVPPVLGRHGWLGLNLDAAPVDWAEVAELVEDSYRRFALKRMLAALDGTPAESRRSGR